MCITVLLLLSMFAFWMKIPSANATSSAQVLPGLTVEGNQLYANGSVVVLKGIDYFDFAFGENGSWMAAGSFSTTISGPTAMAPKGRPTNT